MNLADLRKGPHLSASSISTYIDCGLLYKFGKVDKLPMEFKADALEFGSAIHMTLQEFYQYKLCGDTLPLKTVIGVFEMNWRLLAEKRDDIKYAEGKDFETLLREGRELLTVWYGKLEDNKFRILAIEEPFSFKIPGIPVPLIGAVDLLEEDQSGTIILTDFKTSGRAYSADEVIKNTQLTIYQMAMKANGYKGRDIYLKLDVLIKTKTPKFEPYWTTRSQMEEKRITKLILEVWKGISKGVYIPNINSWKCAHCHFKQACDQWFENGGTK